MRLLKAVPGLMLLFGCNNPIYSHGGEDALPYFSNVFFTYQQGAVKGQWPRSSYDTDVVFGCFLNGGWNYRNTNLEKSFLGIGVTPLIQIQSGYNYELHDDFWRWRTDVEPFAVVNRPANLYKDSWRVLSVGFYVDWYPREASSRENEIGVSLGFGLANLVLFVNSLVSSNP